MTDENGTSSDDSPGEAPSDDSPGEAPSDDSPGETPSDESPGETPSDDGPGDETDATSVAGTTPDDDGERPQLADQRDLSPVYEPSEDSHLLATTVAEHVAAGSLALDLGTGSGYVGDAMRDAGARVVAADVSPIACERANGVGLDVVRADLVSAFDANVFDVVAFNPPYLPTPPDHEWDDWGERALSGGPDGRAVVDPFLETVDRVLAPDGRAYLLVSTLTGLDDVTTTAQAHGLAVREVASEAHPYERLVVLALTPAGRDA